MDSSKKKEKFVETYRRGWGNVSVACEAIGISRQTYYNWRKGDAEFAEQLDDVDERTLDMAETKLIKAIQDERTPELIFYLKTKGKKRGYVERTELTGSDGKALDISIEVIDRAQD